MRVHGAHQPARGLPDPRRRRDARRCSTASLTTEQQKQLEIDRQLDFSYGVPGPRALPRQRLLPAREPRRRVPRHPARRSRRSRSSASRRALHELAEKPRGLVLVTGPTGSGKSTTLAALIDEINRTRTDHIITIEDPIEFLHTHKRCIVNQREIGTDATSFADALRAALRQDPDVILLGEMRDLETISTALTAAETGHLVFGTLHTQSAPSTIDRIIDVFPAAQQDQVRTQLAGTLQGVVTQTLLPTADGQGRVAALEILFPDDAIRNLIRQGKVEQIYSYMQTGSRAGCRRWSRRSRTTCAQVITPEDALARSSRQDQLVGMLERRSAPTVSGLRVAGS